jgi:uncharacterized protein HemX
MESIEMPAMMAALVLMFGAVGAKVGTTQLLARMNSQISHVEQDKQEVLGRLKGAQNQKAVAEQNLRVLETKKTKLSKKLARLRQEQDQYAEEETSRKQRTGIRKVD